MKSKNEDKPKVHKDLEGFDIKINQFGEIVSTHNIEDLNKFLDQHVVDKKLKDREDLDVLREGEEEVNLGMDEEEEE